MIKQQRHGGKRQGAGRKKKVLAGTVLEDADVRLLLADAEPDHIETTAQRHARIAVAALVKKLVAGSNEASRVSAANAILDRGYGKPAVDIGGDPHLPFMVHATPGMTVSAEIRVEARNYANLAIEVLRRICEFGQSETATVAAALSLLNRGLGTVGVAKMPDEFDRRPLGKKEDAIRRAAIAASGRYATPDPPKSSKGS
jgi:hypothetical protein